MKKLYRSAVRSTIGGFVALFAGIFLPAWTLDYWQGWAFFVALGTSSTVATVYIAIHDPRLFASRVTMGPAAEETRTQKIITMAGLPVFVAALVAMVLDHRFGWSPAVPVWVSIAGDIVIVLGLYVYYLVTKENTYAASTVRVIEGQTVCSTGPYAFLRHPMYAGALLVFLGAPLALGSWWGLLVVPVAAAGFAWRLLDEEKVLINELPGYAEYLQRVRYRLVPHVW
jgi:protein-S-isoprenylcysteine O-methyltransferase Ste14